MLPAKIKKILIVRLDRLGDTLLSTPLIDAIKKAYKDAEIFFLASSAGSSVLKGDKKIAGLLVFDVFNTTFREKLSFAKKLRQEKFDVVINTSEKFWPHFFTYYSGSPVRAGFFPGYTQPFKSIFLPLVLTHRIFSPNNPQKSSTKHEVERYMELLSPLNIFTEGEKLTLSLSENSEAWAKEYLKGKGEGYKFIALHLSPKWSSEGWSKEFLPDLAEFLLKEKENIFIIATYGESDRVWVDSIKKAFPPRRFSIFFGTDFSRWVSLLSMCSLLISMDTGTVHVASALGVPVIDIFPSGNFAHCSGRWRPWKVPCRIIKRDALSGETKEDERRFFQERLQAEILSALEEFI